MVTVWDLDTCDVSAAGIEGDRFRRETLKPEAIHHHGSELDLMSPGKSKDSYERRRRCGGASLFCDRGAAVGSSHRHLAYAQLGSDSDNRQHSSRMHLTCRVLERAPESLFSDLETQASSGQ